MKVRTRFIKSVIATAAAQDVKMPWERGTPRRTMIARQTTPVLKVRSA
jgi:hypothetical protein